MRRLVLAWWCLAVATAEDAAVTVREFVADPPSTREVHAATIVETADGFSCAWFGGEHEGSPDVGIWLARRDARGWSTPTRVATGGLADGSSLPCWNPVLARAADSSLLLFSKVGASFTCRRGVVQRSRDDGATWTPPEPLPDDHVGPVKDKPFALPDGTLLCPSSNEDHGWRVHMEFLHPDGAWTRTPPLCDGTRIAAIQPTLLRLRDGTLLALCRNRWAERILATRSRDGGATWSAFEPTDLPHPNSGIDAVNLADGRLLLVANLTTTGRSPLQVALSDDGSSWRIAAVLEDAPGEYSYPAVVQARDGTIHVAYTWRRQRIAHVVLDPARLR